MIYQKEESYGETNKYFSKIYKILIKILLYFYAFSNIIVFGLFSERRILHYESKIISKAYMRKV